MTPPNSILLFRLALSRIAEIREIIDTFDLVQQLLERDVAAVLTEGNPAGIS